MSLFPIAPFELISCISERWIDIYENCVFVPIDYKKMAAIRGQSLNIELYGETFKHFDIWNQ